MLKGAIVYTDRANPLYLSQTDDLKHVLPLRLVQGNGYVLCIVSGIIDCFSKIQVDLVFYAPVLRFTSLSK